MKYPDPIIQEIEGITVVRDDLIPGGTKARVIGQFLNSAAEYVYPSPAYGYAQIALAHACQSLDIQATIFTAKRKQLHLRTLEAQNAGAKIVQIPNGYLSNVKAQARRYCEMSGAELLPFGFDFPAFRAALADIARSLPVTPSEVWTVAGSGTLSRALQMVWPDARFFMVRVGMQPETGRAELLTAPETFEQDAKIKPPFASCSNYDAKAWRFIKQSASPGALFWNVAA